MDSINLQDRSSDGRYVVYMTSNARGGTGLWVLSLSGAGRAVPFTETSARESQAQISPDTKWLAYTSNETGRDEVYVQSFPNAGHKQQVTTVGGVMPRWRKDMGELFFVDSRGRLNAATVRKGASLAFGPASPLFQTDIPFWGAAAIDWRALYATNGDGNDS